MRDFPFVAVNRVRTETFQGIPWSDTILKLTRNLQGVWSAQVVFDGFALPGNNPQRQAEPLNDFAVDKKGVVYAGTPNAVIRIAPPYAPGTEVVFADGFSMVLGMAFDEKDALYVSDGETSSIWRFEQRP